MRRALAAPLALIAALATALPAARADDDGPPWRHGLSLLGELKYPPGFKRFDYVNADAPKGGTVRISVLGTFDSFNIVVAGVKGQVASGIDRLYQTLLSQASDEVSAAYGLIAESVRHPDDFSFASFRLRPEARWHDGKPITPEDVIFSFESHKRLSPQFAFYYRNVTKAEKTGEREVTFIFDQKGNRELPMIMADLPIIPKHWWEGTGPDGKPRSVDNVTLEPPLGSGPYRVKSFEPGRNLVLERVKDAWSANMPTEIGKHNFDELRFEYYRDDTVQLEAFKADKIDFRSENVSRQWATAYDFPARREGKVILEEFPYLAQGVVQGFVFNLRRDKFKDPRVRRALNYAFDFEDANKSLFFGLYQRIGSYWHGLDVASAGLPEGREKEILEEFRDKLPPEVFTTPYANPVGGSPDKVRDNLREAVKLLREAGWTSRDGRLVNAAGERLSVELLTDGPSYERIMLFYKPALERLGIEARIRTVDQTQYENRVRKRDFDMIIHAWGTLLTPGNEQREYWGSAAADREGSQNPGGIKNPVIDALIEKLIFAKDRAEQVATIKALDRVLLWSFYIVPNFTDGRQRTARWDRFSHPVPMPRYAASAFPTIWWWDKDKAAKTGAPR